MVAVLTIGYMSDHNNNITVHNNYNCQSPQCTSRRPARMVRPSIMRSCVLILTLLGLAQSKTYYIKPSQTDRCSGNEQPCQTLLKFATENSNDTNITVIMLPGNHSLNTDLSFSGLTNLAMTSENDNVTIRCDLTSRFSFEFTEEISLKNINFIGCGRNLVRDVGRFILQGVTFRGLDGSGTSLTI